MDWLDVVILALRIVVVALLYLFLVLVLRAAGRGLARPVSATMRSDEARLKLLVLEAGEAKLSHGDVLEIDDGDVLGRSDRADVLLVDPTVSSEHARVSRVGGAWVVVDLGSTNGTSVNATRVTSSVPLAPGDVLALGGVHLRVVGH